MSENADGVKPGIRGFVIRKSRGVAVRFFLRVLLGAGALLWAAALVSTGALAQAPTAKSPIVNQWLTQAHDGVIKITPCASGFCGRIVGMSVRKNPDGSDPTDAKGQKICGLQILTLTPSGAGKWAGHILDPKKDSNYTCEVSMDAEGHLLMRGYLMTPLLGETQTWTPYTGPLHDCTMG
jgi:uncharacterized protein (DUF2147 family)